MFRILTKVLATIGFVFFTVLALKAAFSALVPSETILGMGVSGMLDSFISFLEGIVFGGIALLLARSAFGWRFSPSSSSGSHSDVGWGDVPYDSSQEEYKGDQIDLFDLLGKLFR